MAPSQYRHRGGRCRSCAADVARQGAAAAADEHTYRATFTDAAGQLADTLCADGLVWVRTDWSIPDCRLNPHAPLPAWLHTALAGADLSRPEGGWPNFARCQSPVDWPALIQEHPEWLLPDQDSLDANAGPRWPGIADAYQLLAERGHRPYLDVALWVTEDARISVDPIGLLVEHPPSVPSATVTDVDDLLVAAGRLRQDLHYPNEPTGLCWTLNC